MASSSSMRLADAKPFAKFFRMLRVGLPADAVRQAMRAQGVDERVLSLGGDALVSDLRVPSAAAPGPQVDDRVYRKSLRMLLIGVPPGAVECSMQHALEKDAYEQTLGKLKAALARRSVAAMGPSTRFHSSGSATATAVPLAMNLSPPLFTARKLETMERVGVPTSAIRLHAQAHTVAAQGRGGGTLDLNDAIGTKPSAWTTLFLMASMAPQDASNQPLYGHTVLGRFFKMLRAGVPREAVQNELARSGLPRELALWDPFLTVDSLVAHY